MRIYFALLILLFPLSSSAAENGYRCITKQILELSDSGLMEKHQGIYKDLINKQFSVNRKTGEMVGLPFDTKLYQKITVLDKGSTENAYKAIVTSHPPNMWVLYVYVAEHHHGKKKPFWGTDDGNKIFNGLCE